MLWDYFEKNLVNETKINENEHYWNFNDFKQNLIWGDLIKIGLLLVLIFENLILLKKEDS